MLCTSYSVIQQYLLAMYKAKTVLETEDTGKKRQSPDTQRASYFLVFTVLLNNPPHDNNLPNLHFTSPDIFIQVFIFNSSYYSTVWKLLRNGELNKHYFS